MEKKELIAELSKRMTTYTGTKTIRATKMTRQEYNDLRGWQVPEDEDPNDEGYIVEYQNESSTNVEGFSGYISWSPTKPFEEAYRASDTVYDRVSLERIELEARYNNLKKYLEESKVVPKRELLERQLKAMNEYLDVLWLRLEEMMMC